MIGERNGKIESGDLAYGSGAYELTLSPPGSGAISDKGKYVVVYRRQPEGSSLSRTGEAGERPEVKANRNEV